MAKIVKTKTKKKLAKKDSKFIISCSGLVARPPKKAKIIKTKPEDNDDESKT